MDKLEKIRQLLDKASKAVILISYSTILMFLILHIFDSAYLTKIISTISITTALWIGAIISFPLLAEAIVTLIILLRNTKS